MIRTDRSFASPPPTCIWDYGAPIPEAGSAWLALSGEAVQGATVRQICLNEVSAWIDAERLADGEGLTDE